jgi:hypothetical protein
MSSPLLKWLSSASSEAPAPLREREKLDVLQKIVFLFPCLDVIAAAPRRLSRKGPS